MSRRKSERRNAARARRLRSEPRSERITRTYRDARGRFVSARAAETIGARAFDVRRTSSGKIAAMRPALQSAGEIIKVTERGFIEKRGRFQGRVDEALYRTNITTVRGAKRVEFTIRGRDARDKEHRFKGSLDLITTKQKKMQSGLIVAAIIHSLRARGYRTTYGPRGIDWSKTDESRSVAMRRKPMTDVQITVRVLT